MTTDTSSTSTSTSTTTAPPPNLAAPMYGVVEIAALLHRSENTVRLDAVRAPGRLPPICRLPGHKRLLWRREDVTAWIDAHVQRPPDTPMPLRRRGRPTKAEQRTRAGQTGGAK